MRLEQPAPKPFHFAGTVTDHGWYALEPFRWDEASQTLERIERLHTGRVVLLKIWAEDNHIITEVIKDFPLNNAEITEIKRAVNRMLKLGEDLTPFYGVAKQENRLASTRTLGRGRMLRASNLFEDTIKMICTTNINWAQTEQMTKRLVAFAGSPFPLDPSRKAFPTPDEVAAISAQAFEEEIRFGYRNRYVQTLANEIVAGERNLERLEYSDLAGPALRKELQKIIGIGAYASAALAGLLGSYGDLPIDSEYKAYVQKQYFAGEKVSDAELRSVYESWGEWKMLAYWFDRVENG